jgi:predicted metalloprotease
MSRPLSARLRASRTLCLVLAASLFAGAFPLLSAAGPAPGRSLALSPAGATLAQEGAPVPEVTDDSYTSPLGYELDWGRDWDLSDSFGTYGLDLAVLEPDTDAQVQVWGFMAFGGDPVDCLDQMAGFYPQFFQVEELEPVDADDAGVDGPIGPADADDVAFGTFDYLEGPRDDEPQRLYIGCQTLEAGESVNVFVVSATERDFEDEVAAADELLDDGFTADPTEVDTDAFADRVDTLSTDIDRFYQRSLRIADEGIEYSAPLYQTYDAPTDSNCLSANIDGTIDRRDPQQFPGAGPAYCGADNRILVDAPWMTIYVLPQGGDVLLATVLAHESGHHLQEITGWGADYDNSDPKDTFIIEQQADCLAGAYMRSTVVRGIYTERDVQAAIGLFNDIGGFEAGVDHGTGEEREDALLTGYDEGFDACGLFDDRR